MNAYPIEIPYPPVRKMFIPDLGYTLCSSDLDRADLQVVAWDSNCETLKTLLKEGLDIHLYNVGVYFKKDITLDQLRDPARTKELLKLYKKLRNEKAKGAQHALNYLVQDKTLSQSLGLTISEAAEIRKKHFSMYPEISEWHKKVWLTLLREQKVTNRFGFHVYHFGRLSENDLKEYVAWIPQSTVAIIINKAWAKLEDSVPEAKVLLQVHDELIYQIPTLKFPSLKPRIKEAFQIPVPYEDPLIIPAGLKTSTLSWGDAVEDSWN